MDNENVPTPPSGEEESKNTEENATNILLTPDGQAMELDEPTLRELVNMGAIRQVGTAIKKPTNEPFIFDFFKELYPKDPEGARRYFEAEAESKKNDI